VDAVPFEIRLRDRRDHDAATRSRDPTAVYVVTVAGLRISRVPAELNVIARRI
jgi:hypothetical protein